MKKIFYGALMLTVLASCGSEETNIDTAETDNQPQEEIIEGTYALTPEESSLIWHGTWLGGDSDGKAHNGNITLSEGSVTKQGDNYSGNFIVDMTTINNLDIEDETYKAKLENHLLSNEFFNVEKFPTTEVILKSIINNEALVTIKTLGLEIEQTFPVNVNTTKDKMTLSGTLSLDLKDAKMIGMEVDDTNGGVSSVINFELNANLTKI